MTTKFLFAIFIADDKTNQQILDPTLIRIDNELNKTAGNKASIIIQSNPELDRLEQFGHYYDKSNKRIVFFGVADSKEIVNVIDGKVNLTGFISSDERNVNTAASNFVRAICNNIRLGFPNNIAGNLPNDRCTWIVIPLDELAGGYGTLFVEGMAGESGNG